MLIDLILFWALMLGWAFAGVVAGALLVGGYVIIKDWSDTDVEQES